MTICLIPDTDLISIFHSFQFYEIQWKIRLLLLYTQLSGVYFCSHYFSCVWYKHSIVSSLETLKLPMEYGIQHLKANLHSLKNAHWKMSCDKKSFSWKLSGTWKMLFTLPFIHNFFLKKDLLFNVTNMAIYNLMLDTHINKEIWLVEIKHQLFCHSCREYLPIETSKIQIAHVPAGKFS